MSLLRSVLVSLVFATTLGSAFAQPKLDRSGLTRDDGDGDAGSTRPKGRRVAFLVGVGTFKHDLPNLGGSPQKDVTKLGELLKAGGFEVVTLTDARATRADVEAQFATLVSGGKNPAKALGKADVLLVAVCTHGFSLPPIPGSPDAPYLAAHDSKLDQPDSMIGLNGLIDAGKSSGATVLFLLDACRELPADKNRGVTRGFEPTRAILPVGTAVLFGCGRGQVSHQSEKADGHGLFTYAVLKTLRGEMGLIGELSWTELVAAVQKAFLSPEFKAMMPANRPQTPFSAGGELPYTDLLSVVNRLAKDYATFRGKGASGPRADFRREEILREAAPTRLTAWRQAAEKGDPAGQLLYGYCFQFGTGVAKDDAEAIKWIRKAAEAGNPDAMINLALRYRRGLGVTKDPEEDLKWCRKAADTGNTFAMNSLGWIYDHGIAVEKDEAEAAKWYRKTAMSGDRAGMYRLGLMLETGRGVTKDEGEAAKWFRKAAEGGLAIAMVAIGKMYESGRGVAKDEGEAVRWFRKAADAGQTDAMSKLGAAYESGKGIAKDPVKAIEWYQKAAAAGNEAAKDALKRLGKK